MLTIGTMPIMLKIVGKLDIKPIIPMLKKTLIFSRSRKTQRTQKTLSRNFQKKKVGVLACEVLAEITPQLGKIADDLPAACSCI